MLSRCRHIGTAAEHLIISELLKRDHEVAVPVVDVGVDLVVDYQIKVQVKAASSYNNTSFTWSFGKKKLHLLSDVFVLVGIADKEYRYWIVPASAMAEYEGNSAVSIPVRPQKNRGKTHRFISLWGYEDAWHILKP